MSSVHIGGPSAQIIASEVERQHRRGNGLRSEAPLELHHVLISDGGRKVVTSGIVVSGPDVSIPGKVNGRDIAADGAALDELMNRPEPTFTPPAPIDWSVDIAASEQRMVKQFEVVQGVVDKYAGLIREYIKGAAAIRSEVELFKHKIPEIGPLEVRLSAVSRANGLMDQQLADLRAHVASLKIPKEKSRTPIIVFAALWPLLILGAYLTIVGV